MIKEFLKSNPIHNKIVPSLDMIMISRLSYFFGVWAMVCIGMYICDLINNCVDINSITISFSTSMLFLGISFICAAIFINNQIYDLETDKNNNKKIIIDNYITIDFSKKVSLFFIVCGLLLIFFIDYLVVSPMALLYLIFKHNIFLYFLFYMILALFLILSGITYSRSGMSIINLFAISIKYLTPFLLLYGAVVLAVNILDQEGDRLSNRCTIPQNIGVRFTSIIAFLMCSLSFLIGLYIEEPLSVVCSISSVPYFLF